MVILVIDRFQKAKQIFADHQGLLRRKTALEVGIHPATLYSLRDSAEIEELSRGLFALKGSVEINLESNLAATQRIPKGVLCLISALSFHGITTQIPHQVYIAVPKDVKSPRVKYPPIRVFHFSDASYQSGVEKHIVNGVELKIYGPEKTVVDTFKFRNQIGLDVAIEALKLCIQKFKSSPADFMRFAKICRVSNVMLPYLENLS